MIIGSGDGGVVGVVSEHRSVVGLLKTSQHASRASTYSNETKTSAASAIFSRSCVVDVGMSSLEFPLC